MDQKDDKLSEKPEAEPSREDLLLQRLFDGELRPSEKRDFEQRLAEDEVLKLGFRKLERDRALIREAAEDPLPLGLDFGDRLLVRIEKERLPEITGPELVEVRLKTWISVAAALLFYLLGAFLLSRPGKQESIMADPKRKVLERLDREYERSKRREESAVESPEKGFGGSLEARGGK